jgi:hypothetical protein
MTKKNTNWVSTLEPLDLILPSVRYSHITRVNKVFDRSLKDSLRLCVVQLKLVRSLIRLSLSLRSGKLLVRSKNRNRRCKHRQIEEYYRIE